LGTTETLTSVGKFLRTELFRGL